MAITSFEPSQAFFTSLHGLGDYNRQHTDTASGDTSHTAQTNSFMADEYMYVCICGVTITNCYTSNTQSIASVPDSPSSSLRLVLCRAGIERACSELYRIAHAY